MLKFDDVIEYTLVHHIIFHREQNKLYANVLYVLLMLWQTPCDMLSCNVSYAHVFRNFIPRNW